MGIYEWLKSKYYQHLFRKKAREIEGDLEKLAIEMHAKYHRPKPLYVWEPHSGKHIYKTLEEYLAMKPEQQMKYKRLDRKE